MRRNYYRTDKEVGCIIHSWGLSIDGLVHRDINTKNRGIVMINISWTTGGCFISNRYWSYFFITQWLAVPCVNNV